jgi:hypothetical protein
MAARRPTDPPSREALAMASVDKTGRWRGGAEKESGEAPGGIITVHGD